MMFNIDASVLRDQAKTVRNSHFYLSLVLNDDVTPHLMQNLTKVVHKVNGWEFEEETKAKWYSKVFSKPVQKFVAHLEVYDNGLVHYELCNANGKKEPCTARTISNIFQLSVTDCYATQKNEPVDNINGILTSVLVRLNKKKA